MFLIPFLTFGQFLYIIGVIGAFLYQIHLIFQLFFKSKLQRRVPKRSTAPANTKSSSFIRDIRHKHDTLPKESAEWVNVFLNKFYADFYNSTAFNYYFYTQYVRAIFNLRRTIAGYVISKVDITSFCTGKELPRIKNVAVPYQSSDHSSVTLTMDMEYDPNIQATVELNTIFGINLLAVGDCKTLNGTLMFEYNPDTYSYAFLRTPHVELTVRATINGWEFQWVNRLIQFVWLKLWLGKNVLPKTRTIWHRNKPPMPPYPWEVSHDPELLYKWPKPANAKYDPEDTDCE